MALNDILLVVRPGDEGYGAKLAQTLLDIAQPTDANVRIAIVLTEGEFDAITQGLGIEDATEASADEIARRHGTFQNVVETVDDAGLDYELSISLGPHAERVLDLATDSDLVIIGGPKRSPTGKAVFGSDVHKVLQSAPCPVVFVRRE